MTRGQRRVWLALEEQKRRRARAGASVPPVSLRSGLAAYWDLDETDATGWLPRADKLGLTPVVAGATPILSGPGIRNLGAVFTGGQGLIGSASRVSVAADFSLSLWVYVSNCDNWQIAFNLYESDSDTDCFQVQGLVPVGDAGGAVSGSLFGVDGGFVTAWLPVNQWHHLVVTMQDNLMSFYHNGGLVDAATVSAGSRVMPDQVRIGAGSSIYGWVGPIDEVGFWSRALTASEAVRLYNNGSGLAYDQF